MDPRSFSNEEEFVRAYNVAWAHAQAAEQVISFVEKMIEESEGLTKKEKGEITDKLREAIS